MRPEISSLIQFVASPLLSAIFVAQSLNLSFFVVKSTLYPKLQNNAIVQDYPRVRGMKENVFFLDHHEPEGGGGGADISKHNIYEVSIFISKALRTALTEIFSSLRSRRST